MDSKNKAKDDETNDVMINVKGTNNTIDEKYSSDQ